MKQDPTIQRRFLLLLPFAASLVASAAAGCGDDSDTGTGGGSGGASGTTSTTSGVTGSTSASSTSSSTSSTGAGASGGGGSGGGEPACTPGERRCTDGAVEACDADGGGFTVVETCGDGHVCADGACASACDAAAAAASNAGCEFWAVDLDQQDYGNDPASAEWGVLLSNVGTAPAEVVIEVDDGEPGDPAALTTIAQITVDAGAMERVPLPTRELDCGIQPNDYDSPGTCLSSKAFRITSSSPLVVTQVNPLDNGFSNDASLLLPASALGRSYRVVGWNAGHPIDPSVPGFDLGVDRSFITVVGTADDTQVTVSTSWRIKGNPPIAATAAGDSISVTLDAFDVLNLETDDGTDADDPITIADLSGSAVVADKPVAVFSGSESTGVPGWLDVPTFPGWVDGDTGFLDHLEEQLLPLESLGAHYVVTRSPVRSLDGWREPDVVRFVGGAEVANVRTSLPPPWDDFTLDPGEVKTTSAQDSFIAEADVPFLVGQLLVGEQLCTRPIGDPSLVVFPSAEQHRSEQVVQVPPGWEETWVVVAVEVEVDVTVDGDAPSDCIVEPAGTVLGVDYEARTCPIAPGEHAFASDAAFGVVVYGYAQSGSVAFVGGTGLAAIYEPPLN